MWNWVLGSLLVDLMKAPSQQQGWASPGWSFILTAKFSCLLKMLNWAYRDNIVSCCCRYLRWRTAEQRSTARCGGRDPVRLNNTRQALFFLLLLLSCFSPPSTSSCPQSQFSTGFILRPTLFLYLSLHFYPSLSPFLLICMSCPNPPSGPARVSIFHIPGVLPYFWWLILQACTL